MPLGADAISMLPSAEASNEIQRFSGALVVLQLAPQFVEVQTGPGSFAPTTIALPSRETVAQHQSWSGAAMDFLQDKPEFVEV